MSDVENPQRVLPATSRAPVLGGLLFIALVVGSWVDAQLGWFDSAYRLLGRLFYEQWALAELRRPSQLILARWHLSMGLLLLSGTLLVRPWVSRHAWLALLAFCAGYAVRAGCWVMGGNLPLVPGDSCHYIEVATSVYRGEGPVKHYVESFFRDYRPQGILEGQGVLDDWATPLWAYALAACYRITGVVPGVSLEATFAVAKGLSFVLNLLCLPLLYLFVRRNWNRDTALGSLALLAVLPVHAIYAGFELRESLVVFTGLAALMCLAELFRSRGGAAWGWAVPAGLSAGFAMLARDTMIVFVGASYLYGLVSWRRTHLLPLLLAGMVALVVVAPWAWWTYQVYGSAFYSYTRFFAYNFSWTVHHYDRGNTRPEQFFTTANLPEILRIKVRALGVILLYSTMILSVPVAAGFWGGLKRTESGERVIGNRLARMIGFTLLCFVLATLVRIADVSQVEQLGRYYLPLYVLMIPCAVTGFGDWLDRFNGGAAGGWILATVTVLLWADPSWSYDAVWFRRPYQLHWPALVDAGRWIQDHPAEVPPNSRILTWFPWELRVTSNQTTVLFPRALEGGDYERRRIEETLAHYQVTHVLWGSFEPSPDANVEKLGSYLDALRQSVGLSDSREIFHSGPALAFPVRLYKVQGTRP